MNGNRKARSQNIQKSLKTVQRREKSGEGEKRLVIRSIPHHLSNMAEAVIYMGMGGCQQI